MLKVGAKVMTLGNSGVNSGLFGTIVTVGKRGDFGVEFSKGMRLYWFRDFQLAEYDVRNTESSVYVISGLDAWFGMLSNFEPSSAAS